MKLITETTFNDIEIQEEVISEEGKPDKKNYYIKGIYLQADAKNRNGRIYEKTKVLEPVVENYLNNYVKTGRALGECGHPPTPQINLERVSHRTIDLAWNGNDVYGNSLVLDTPLGNVVKGLLEGGSKLGVSSRGVGTLERRTDKDAFYVKDDFDLKAIDVVSDPSASKAFVEGILEGVEWIYQNETLIPLIEKTKKAANRVYRPKISEEERTNLRLRIFEDFLNKVAKSL
jgi:hypothetical protein